MNHLLRLALLTFLVTLLVSCASPAPAEPASTPDSPPPTATRVHLAASPTSTQLPPAPSATLTPRATQTRQPLSPETSTPVVEPTRQPSPAAAPISAYGPPGDIIYFDSISTFFMGPADKSEPASLAYEDHHDPMIDMMQGISWSPDGRSIAFAMTPWSDIYLYTLGQPDSVNLTKTGKFFEEYPAWSPNGKLIAFTSDRRQVKGKYTSDLYTMRTDGSGVTMIYECPGRCDNPEWSPDGKSIVFQQDNDLYIIPKSGGKPFKLTQGGVNQYPAWSPDGEWIAFVRSVTLDPPAYIYLVKPDGTGMRALTGKDTQPRQLTWSPDGRYIAFENFASEKFGVVILDMQSGEITYWLFGYTPSWRPMDISKLPTPAATPAGVTANCSSGWSRLQVGGQAQVSGKAGDPPNRVRESPSKSAQQIGLINPGTVVSLLEGPVCADGLVFWKVASDEIPGGSGWTAEGDGAEYWLNPYQ